MLKYRNTEYYYKEWTTWNGKFAQGYTCNDMELLKYVNVVSFGAQTEQEMHDKIDDYLDNVDHHIKLQKLFDAGCVEYYASKSVYDNYTGD